MIAILIDFRFWAIPLIISLAAIVYFLIPIKGPDTFGLGVAFKFILSFIVVILSWLIYCVCRIMFHII